MEIEIKNCNNIKQGNIHIEEGKINIFYGINGTGKSTISKAIDLKINSGYLESLKPFGCETTPEVTLSDNVRRILAFNEDYINNFVYKEDEVLSNSFEIFIRTDEYKENEKNINELLQGIKDLFENDETLNIIIKDFGELSPCFKWNNDGCLSKASDFHKACGNGNLIENIPEHLVGYASFIKSQNCTQRVDWQIKGNIYGENSNICPYCTSDIIEKKEQIKQVSETYNKNNIEKLVKIRKIIDELGMYFSDDTRENIMKITNQADGLLLEQENFLKTVSDDIETLYKKLQKLKNISFDSFKEGENNNTENIKTILNTFKINLDYINNFQSTYTQNIINGFNSKIDNLVQQIGSLTLLINQQKGKLRSLVKKYKVGINSFLQQAGFNYEIDMPSDLEYKLRLKPKGSLEYLNGGNQHLSFGEKNAFALILFMYEVLSKKPDLVILDDPISSFDENKKYAIIHTLFTGNDSLIGKTVIMLTHDIEPIIDMKKVKTDIFNNNSVYSSYIRNKNGNLEISEISKDDILSFYQIWGKIKSSNANEIIKIVYLRKLYYGFNNTLGNEFQVLSNLLHGRSKEMCVDYRLVQDTPLSDEDFNNGVDRIKSEWELFDYDKLQKYLSNKEEMLKIYNETDSSLTKIIIFRRIYELTNQENQNNPENQNDQDNIDEIVDKFIKEEYHIENSYLFGLDPTKFDIIPDFIIKECDKFINNLNI